MVSYESNEQSIAKELDQQVRLRRIDSCGYYDSYDTGNRKLIIWAGANL